MQPRRFTANAASYLRHPEGIEHHITTLVEGLVRDLGFVPRSFVVHLSSNNGFATLAAVLRIFQREGKGNMIRSNLKAVVMDSAPSFTPQMSTWQSLCAVFWLHFGIHRDAIPYMRQMAGSLFDTPHRFYC